MENDSQKPTEKLYKKISRAKTERRIKKRRLTIKNKNDDKIHAFVPLDEDKSELKCI